MSVGKRLRNISRASELRNDALKFGYFDKIWKYLHKLTNVFDILDNCYYFLFFHRQFSFTKNLGYELFEFH